MAGIQKTFQNFNKIKLAIAFLKKQLFNRTIIPGTPAYSFNL